METQEPATSTLTHHVNTDDDDDDDDGRNGALKISLSQRYLYQIFVFGFISKLFCEFNVDFLH